MSIKANRPQLRGCWRAIVEAHLREGARSPVSINEQMRWAICHQIERACRRQVLFLDDCETVNRMLVDQVGLSDRASEAVKPWRQQPALQWNAGTGFWQY